MEYTISEKLSYFQKRVNDKNLTPNQRNYAKKRIDYFKQNQKPKKKVKNFNDLSIKNKYSKKQIKQYYLQKYNNQADVVSNIINQNMTLDNINQTEYTRGLNNWRAYSKEAYRSIISLFSRKSFIDNFKKESYYYHRSNGKSHKEATNLVRLDVHNLKVK